MFSKKDLKDNDIVYYRDESKRIVKGENLLDIAGNICYNLNRYREDLIEEDKNIGLDIVKVERLENKIIYERKEILDKKEKEYLNNVIKPFKDKVRFISKNLIYDNEFIKIKFKNDIFMYFPKFKSGTKYKNMLLDKYYTLEELELN